MDVKQTEVVYEIPYSYTSIISSKAPFMTKTKLDGLRTSSPLLLRSVAIWFILKFIFSVKSNLVLTILGVVFLLVHLLEVQYNAFEDKDNMLFILFKCFVLDINTIDNKLHELCISINLAKGKLQSQNVHKIIKAKFPSCYNHWQV